MITTEVNTNTSKMDHVFVKTIDRNKGTMNRNCMLASVRIKVILFHCGHDTLNDFL